MKKKFKCAFAGCKKTDRKGGKGYCGMHWQRIRRYGDPKYVTSLADWRLKCRNGQPRTGKLKSTSYVKYLGRHEHRVVMEKMIGRPLTRREVVHHIDGNRHNNHPSNLAIITQSVHINEHREDLVFGRRRAIAARKNGTL